MRVYLSLGSNLGDRKRYIREAIWRLHRSGAVVIRVSCLYESEPVGVREPQPAFLNAVAEIEWSQNLLSLLSVTEAVERQMGRGEKGSLGQRVIDIDILWAEGERVTSPRLTVPHPKMWDRAFVLLPLSELVCHLDGINLRDRAKKLSVRQAIRIFEGEWWVEQEGSDLPCQSINIPPATGRGKQSAGN